MIWEVGTVNIGTAYATAHLSDGATERIASTVLGGRKYVAVGFVDPVRLTRLTLYDAHGHVLAQIAKIPPVI